MKVKKRVRFVDQYGSLELLLRKWLKWEYMSRRDLSLVEVQRMASQFAREVELYDMKEVNAWCITFFDKFCDKHNIGLNAEKERDIKIAETRKKVLSNVQPIGNVPLHMVGSFCSEILRFTNPYIVFDGSKSVNKTVVFNSILCCFSNGTKLPPMVITNSTNEAVGNEVSDKIIIVKKDDPSFDEELLIKWLNNVWSLRHNISYQPHSLLVTNVSFTEDYKKLLSANATEVFILPKDIAHDLLPFNKAVMDDFFGLIKTEYRNWFTDNQRMLERSDWSRIDEYVCNWISSAWDSFSTENIMKLFEPLGLIYIEDEAPTFGFTSNCVQFANRTRGQLGNIIMLLISIRLAGKVRSDTKVLFTSGLVPTLDEV